MTMRFPIALPLAAAVAVLSVGCTVETVEPQARVYVPEPQAVAAPYATMAVVSVYIDPPLYQPPPIAVAWAPPPMLVEAPPPVPMPGAVWIGGNWTWQGDWVWAAGRWSPPPRPNYTWVQPYYEHRDAAVIFVGGYWAAPGVVFVPPPPTMNIALVSASAGVVPGPRPMGPQGVFIPPPPGSRPGIVVPAPIGTPPAVVVSAPPVTNVGMRVQAKVNNTDINNVRTTNVVNVTVIAPAEATLSRRAYEASVPAQAHLAARLTPVVHAAAPVPVSSKPIPAFVPGRERAVLPPAQMVRSAGAANVAPAAAPRPPGSAPPPAAQRLPHVATPVELGRTAPNETALPPTESPHKSAARAPQPAKPAVVPLANDQAPAAAPQRPADAKDKAAAAKAAAAKAAAAKAAAAKAAAAKAARSKLEKEEAERREHDER